MYGFSWFAKDYINSNIFLVKENDSDTFYTMLAFKYIDYSLYIIKNILFDWFVLQKNRKNIVIGLWFETKRKTNEERHILFIDFFSDYKCRKHIFINSVTLRATSIV